MCACVFVCLAVTRPQSWPFPCQDKHRCHTATVALRARLRGNKPEPQPCGSVLMWWILTFQLDTKIIFWQDVVQLETVVLRSALKGNLGGT